LRRAAEILGGEEKLALRLKVTPSHLSIWLAGIDAPPTQVFFEAVDLITEHDVSSMSTRQPPPSADAASK